MHTPSFDSRLANDAAIVVYRNIMGSELDFGDGFEMKLPMWLVFTYLGINTILNFLNLYWFAKMIQALRKRFQPPDSIPKKEK